MFGRGQRMDLEEEDAETLVRDIRKEIEEEVRRLNGDERRLVGLGLAEEGKEGRWKL